MPLLAPAPRLPSRMPQDVPNEVSVLAHPESIPSKGEAYSTFHLFIQQRVSRVYSSITSKLFHPTHKQIPTSMELGSLFNGESGHGDMENTCQVDLRFILHFSPLSYPMPDPMPSHSLSLRGCPLHWSSYSGIAWPEDKTKSEDQDGAALALCLRPSIAGPSQCPRAEAFPSNALLLCLIT